MRRDSWQMIVLRSSTDAEGAVGSFTVERAVLFTPLSPDE